MSARERSSRKPISRRASTGFTRPGSFVARGFRVTVGIGGASITFSAPADDRRESRVAAFPRPSGSPRSRHGCGRRSSTTSRSPRRRAGRRASSPGRPLAAQADRSPALAQVEQLVDLGRRRSPRRLEPETTKTPYSKPPSTDSVDIGSGIEGQVGATQRGVGVGRRRRSRRARRSAPSRAPRADQIRQVGVSLEQRFASRALRRAARPTAARRAASAACPAGRARCARCRARRS